MQNLFAYLSSTETGLTRSALEVLGAGRRLADNLGEDLIAGIACSDPQAAVAAAFAAGADGVYVVQDPILAQYDPELYRSALFALVEQADPRVLLFVGDLVGRDLAPRVAHRLQASIVTEVTDLRTEGKSVLMTRPIYGGKAMADYASKTDRQVIVLRPKTQEPAVPVEGKTGEAVKVSFAPPESAIVGKLVDAIRAAVSGVRLEDARIVISGGRGLGGQEPFGELERLAGVLGGAVGASRAACDAGWVPPSMQVGQTGSIVAPDLYIAIGISGASQHVAGISGAKMVVAINKDPEAPIFKRANLGVVADYRTVLPALIEQCKQLF